MKENNPCKYSGKRVLLVEGKNDCHVILALCETHKIPETFGIYDCESDTKLLLRLNALILQPDMPEIIGIVMDADKPDVMGRWQSIQSKIKAHQYLFPEFPNESGTILAENPGKPRLGIWLMPNNQDSGMLEDFLAKMARPEAIAAAYNCVNMAKAKGVSSFKEAHYSKAVIHTYLAWQDEPGKTLGQSVTSEALKPHTEIAEKFTDWLKRLFTD